jgi:hypothetical protein
MKNFGFSVVPGRFACDASISCESRCLLAIISSHYSDDGGAWPSLATLGAYLGRSRSTVLRCLTELEQRKLIRRVHRFDQGRQKSTRYELLFDRWSVTDETPEGVIGDTPRGVTHESQTVPNNKIKKPPYPRNGGKGAADRTRTARTRAERKLLETYAGACDKNLPCLVCGDAIGEPWIVEKPNGTIGVSIYPIEIVDDIYRGKQIISATHDRCRDRYDGSIPA